VVKRKLNRESIKILAVEDSLIDVKIIEKFSDKNRAGKYNLVHVGNLKAALEKLKKVPFDIILLDLSLPDSEGLDTFEKIHGVAAKIPTVVITATDDEMFALDIVQKGAQDYLMKGQFDSKLFSRVIRNAIERKRTEQALRNMVIELEKKNEELVVMQNQLIQSEKMASVGILSAGVAHEIKNPLAIILQGMEIIERGLVNTKDKNMQKCATKVENAAERANKVVNSLLMFSRSSKLEMKPFNLRLAIDSVVELIKNRAKLNNVEINRNYCKEDYLVDGDIVLIQQVFFELLTNALRIMPEGGSVTLTTKMKEISQHGIEANTYTVEIQDTGKGIAEENISKIFDPFFTTREKGQGTGLGLSTVYLILERHNGRITVVSKQGVGTTFAVFLPVIGLV